MSRHLVVHSFEALQQYFPAPTLKHRPATKKDAKPKQLYPAPFVRVYAPGVADAGRSPIFVAGVGEVQYSVYCSLNFSVEAPSLAEQLRSLGVVAS
jgi:hypothetical protein